MGPLGTIWGQFWSYISHLDYYNPTISQVYWEDVKLL